MSWALRRAVPADLDGIMALESSIFAADAWSADTMRKDLVNARCCYLVAVPVDDGDAVVGYAGVFAPEGAPEAEVQTIAVAETARRAGLGRALMAALVAEARKRGAERVFLEVRADNPAAQSLYDSLGFERIAVRESYYQPDGVDAIVMRLRIPEPRTALAEQGGTHG